MITQEIQLQVWGNALQFILVHEDNSLTQVVIDKKSWFKIVFDGTLLDPTIGPISIEIDDKVHVIPSLGALYINGDPVDSISNLNAALEVISH